MPVAKKYGTALNGAPLYVGAAPAAPRPAPARALAPPRVEGRADFSQKEFAALESLPNDAGKDLAKTLREGKNRVLQLAKNTSKIKQRLAAMQARVPADDEQADHRDVRTQQLQEQLDAMDAERAVVTEQNRRGVKRALVLFDEHDVRAHKRAGEAKRKPARERHAAQVKRLQDRVEELEQQAQQLARDKEALTRETEVLTRDKEELQDMLKDLGVPLPGVVSEEEVEVAAEQEEVVADAAAASPCSGACGGGGAGGGAGGGKGELERGELGRRQRRQHRRGRQRQQLSGCLGRGGSGAGAAARWARTLLILV